MAETIDLKTELDKLVSRLSGVLAARTVLNEQDEIVEIHILSDLTKSPKQLVRDAQSAIMAAFGIDIDYKLISVAQVNGNMVAPPTTGELRLKIRRIMISLDSTTIETTVVLAQGDRVFEGSSRSPLSGRNRIHAAVSACLAALKNYFGQMVNITLLDLQRHSLGGTDCFSVALSYVEPNLDTVLYGIAPINSPETEVQSAVMAVLSALNRTIGKPKKS
jgi:hypothetical protein